MKTLRLLFCQALAPCAFLFAQPTPVSSGSGDSLPSQSGNSGKYLTTNGSAASWGTPAGAGDAVTTDPLSQFAATTSAQLRSVLSDETGTGIAYFVGGALGTPASGTGTNLSGIPIASGISGLGTSVAAFLADPTFLKLNTALTGDDAAGLAANNNFTGINSFAGATVKPANALAALAIDVTKGLNTKTVSADQTFTFSGTPATAGTLFSLRVTNSDAAAHTLTIPSSYAVGIGAVTSLIIPGSGKLLLTWEYDGSAYNLYGAPALVNGTGSYVLSDSPTFTGTPDAPTATAGTSDTQLATTAFSTTAAKATRLGSHASPDTTAGSITWTSAVYEVFSNTTTTYALPAAAGYDGKALIVYVTGTNAVTIDANGSEVIVRDGTAQTGGVTMTLTGVAGNYVCIICDGTRWITLGFKGTLAAGS